MMTGCHQGGCADRLDALVYQKPLAWSPADRGIPLTETGFTTDPDAEIVERARRGDDDALSELYRRHSTRGYNLALRMLGNPWDAGDVTQEAFIKAFANLNSFRGQARFSTWLHRIVVNAVYDFTRRRRPDPLDDSILDQLAGSEGSRVFSSAAVSPAEDGLSPEIRQALLALSEDFRMTIVLCDLLGYGYAEAAEILEVQEGTIKSRVFRARAELATRLREAGWDVPDTRNQRRPDRVTQEKAEEPSHAQPADGVADPADDQRTA